MLLCVPASFAPHQKKPIILLIQTQPPLTTVPCIAGVPNDAQLSIGTNTEELDVKWGL